MMLERPGARVVASELLLVVSTDGMTEIYGGQKQYLLKCLAIGGSGGKAVMVR